MIDTSVGSYWPGRHGTRGRSEQYDRLSVGATNLSRDGSARLVVHAHDQQFVGMPLVVDSARRDAPTSHDSTRAKSRDWFLKLPVRQPFDATRMSASRFEAAVTTRARRGMAAVLPLRRPYQTSPASLLFEMTACRRMVN
jgi:hypothetical protein